MTSDRRRRPRAAVIQGVVRVTCLGGDLETAFALAAPQWTHLSLAGWGIIPLARTYMYLARHAVGPLYIYDIGPYSRIYICAHVLRETLRCCDFLSIYICNICVYVHGSSLATALTLQLTSNACVCHLSCRHQRSHPNHPHARGRPRRGGWNSDGAGPSCCCSRTAAADLCPLRFLTLERFFLDFHTLQDEVSAINLDIQLPLAHLFFVYENGNNFYKGSALIFAQLYSIVFVL